MRRTAIVAGFAALAWFATQSPALSQSGSVTLAAPSEITAGKSGIVKASVFSFSFGPDPVRSCRLTSTGRPRLRGLGRRTARTKFSWRVRVPARAKPDFRYKLRVTCGGAGADRDDLTVRAAKLKPRILKPTIHPGGIWTLKVQNPSRRWEIRNSGMRLTFIDGDNRVISTETPGIGLITSGQQRLLSGTVEEAGETITRIKAVAQAGERWPRTYRPLQVSYPRIVTGGDEFFPERRVRAQITNPNKRKVAPVGAVTYFDSAGRVIGSDSLLFELDDIPPRGATALDTRIFPSDLAERVESVNVDASFDPN